MPHLSLGRLTTFLKSPLYLRIAAETDIIQQRKLEVEKLSNFYGRHARSQDISPHSAY